MKFLWPKLQIILITWSAHQYQMEAVDCPKRNPGHGKSESTGSLNNWNESWRGIPHVVFPDNTSSAIAFGYFARSPEYQPILLKPWKKKG